jgi:galactokinase
VNLIGEHVDYNDGFVLPMAIDRYCVVTGSADNSDTARVFSTAHGEEVRISLGSPQRHSASGHWSNYVSGVIAGCIELPGVRLRGFSAVIESDVPIGSGLSSSASLEVATATLIEALSGAALDPVVKALLCQQAEHEFAGVPCGIMDQFASVMCREDHLMLLDCSSQRNEQIPFADPEVTVLIINSNVKHELIDGEYGQRRRQCESAARTLGVNSLRKASLAQLEENRGRLSDVEYRRARHVITEIARTRDAAAAAKSGNWQTMGELMHASHVSLRDDYQVSCPELDLLVNLAGELGAEGGVYGSRMTGGGFGGCTVSLVDAARADWIAQCITDRYEQRTGITPKALTSRPAGGAHAVRLSPI